MIKICNCAYKKNASFICTIFILYVLVVKIRFLMVHGHRMNVARALICPHIHDKHSERGARGLMTINIKLHPVEQHLSSKLTKY